MAMLTQINWSYLHNELRVSNLQVENSRVLILHATLEKQIAEGLGSFTQRLIQVTQNRPGKVLLYSDVEHELNTTMNQQVIYSYLILI